MKKRTILLAVVVLSFAMLLSGCDFLLQLLLGNDLSGTWELTFTWEGYSAGTEEMYFDEDGTFTTYSDDYGEWELDGDDVWFQFSVGGYAAYTGTLNSDGDYMSGTMIDVDYDEGTWYAEKISDVYAPRSLAKPAKSAAGLEK